MENITLFVKKLVVLVIIISALMNLTTGEKYAKYLRFVVGLMLVFYTMTTLTGFISDFGSYDANGELAVSGDTVFTDTEKKRNEMIDAAVLDSYGSSMAYALKTSGYDVTRVECYYEEGVMAVNFYAESSRNLAGIKKYINDFYHVESSHIYGYTEAEDE